MKKNIYGAALCSVGVVLAWYGTHGNNIAFNLFKFMAWTALVVDFLIWIGKGAEIYKGPKKEILIRSKFLTQFAGITDVIVMGILAAFGHPVYATIQLLQLVLELDTFSTK